MSHPLPQLAPASDLAKKFEACVHCGLCLPACPTYVETLNEAESPRGRIHLMKAVTDGRLAPSPVVLGHLDSCLVCRGCETACPSNVVYHDILETVRPQIAQPVQHRAMKSRTLDFMVRHILPFPKRAAAAMLPLRLARKLGLGGFARRIAALFPAPLADMTDVLPDGPLITPKIPAFTPAVAPRRGSVVLLVGCVGSLVSYPTNRAAVEVLSHNGYDVHLLYNETCCGALAAHANDPQSASDFAAGLVETLSTRTEDYFISAIAGCGAQLKALDHAISGSAIAADRARAVVAKVRDICEFLAEVGLRPPAGRIERTITYHDPCHLQHAQKITAAPRQLLRQIPGITLVPLPESELCCGAAGTYNLSQPEMAAALGRRKVAAIVSTGAAECVTANVGCELHISRKLRETQAKASSVAIGHVVTLLAESYRLGSSTPAA
jgi:glycolate oxidase iron-sulfur subunit